MKKNIIKSGLILVLLVLGLTYTNNAKAEEEQCHTIHIFCGDGSTNFALVCGSTYQEYLQNEDEMVDVVCN